MDMLRKELNNVDDEVSQPAISLKVEPDMRAESNDACLNNILSNAQNQLSTDEVNQTRSQFKLIRDSSNNAQANANLLEFYSN